MIGQTISHYRITEKLGEGGMGVVYKAEDTNLKRPVALKFLAAHLLGDEDIKARFRREAEAAAALNHPNVCHVYEIGEVDGKTFIAMAFLEGEGLDKKIEAGPLKLNDVLDIAIQTAQGLQAAHEKKIVHRDVKPANLMVTGSGAKQHVTIMDFGLAQLADRSKLTRMDETMGTVTYMSPEQTYGMELDHRTDVWSLGVVLYEMVTSQQPFKGHYDKAVMYSITNEEPEPITGLRAGVPMEFEWIVGKCLAKDIENRYQNTGDMVVDLRNLQDKLRSGKSAILRASPLVSGVGVQPAGSVVSVPDAGDLVLAPYRVIETLESGDDAVTYRAEDTKLQRSVAIRILSESEAHKAEKRAKAQWRILVALAVGLILSLFVSGFLWLGGPSSDVAERRVRRFSFPVENLQSRSPAISPDGRHVVYAAGDGEPALWVRDLDSETPRRLEGTAEAEDPFWSPDSRFIAFAAGTSLKRVEVGGGEPTDLSDLPGRRLYGGSWSPSGERIVFSSGPPVRIYEVPSRGGTPRSLFELDESEEQMFFAGPKFIPSQGQERAVAYTFGHSTAAVKMGLLNLESGTRHELQPGLAGVYSPTGHLLFKQGLVTGNLMVLPFSLETLAAAGEAFPILNQVRDASLSLEGTLVYTGGDTDDQARQLVWRDRQGVELEAVGPRQSGLLEPDISPDGKSVAFETTENDNKDLWVLDLTRGVRTRLTSGPGRELHAAWSPSGREVAYAVFGDDGGIFLKRADGSGDARKLFAGNAQSPSWSPDGRFIIFQKSEAGEQKDLWYVAVGGADGEREPVLFLETPADEAAPSFSPDGKHVVYSSDESGRWEVYVRPFPDGEGKWQLSANGGSQALWSRDGTEIFYVEGDTLMAVPVSTADGFAPGVAEPLFANPALEKPFPHASYAVSRDAQKFLLVESPESGGTRQIHVIENWYEEFRDRE